MHIVKRDQMEWYKSWLIRAAAIVAALIVCALVTVILTHKDPIKVYATMFSGA